MRADFGVRVLDFAVFEEIEGSTSDDFERLLQRMEFGDTTGLSESELREMCVLSLQDRKPAAAGGSCWSTASEAS